MKTLAATVVLVLSALNPVVGGELPVEAFFKTFQYREAKLCPDGSRVAVLTPIRSRVGLTIIGLEKGLSKRAFGDATGDVMWFEWVTPDRLILGLGKDGSNVPGIVAVDRDCTKSTTLVPVGFLGLGTSLLNLRSPYTNEILVTSYSHSRPPSDSLLLFPDVERINIYSGRRVMDTRNPGYVVVWLTDQRGVVRIGVERQETRFRVLHRPNASAPWEKLADRNWDEPGFWPEAFEYDDRTLLVTDRGDGDTQAVYTYDLDRKQIKELAFRHANADLTGLEFSDKKRRMVGACYSTERPEVFWFDPEFRRIQASVDQALTNALNLLVSATADESKMLFLATSDRCAGVYYLLDVATLRLRKLFQIAPSLKPEEMAEMKPIQYAARDGLTIHGYLTLPHRSDGRNLPLVVYPHGGPQWRDSWGFDPAVQFLANRGYAVLQVNFRGSIGYGEAFRRAGFKQWGLKQQDDITDGVKWTITQGIADPKRIAIFGVSYGGFAALTGLEQTPELYRCGISYVGVSDILRTIDRESDLKMFKAGVAESVGDPKKDKAQLEATAPINNVDKIQVPVLLAYGELDPKVPIETGRSLAKALKKRGHLAEFMVKEDEGHGFRKESNRIEFWKKVDAFLKANMN